MRVSKKLIYSIIIMIAGLSQAQVIISNQANPTPTNSSVLLEFGNNENKGIILPSVSEVTSPVAGTFAVNTTAKAVQYYDGTAWVNLTYPNMLIENTFVNDSIADVGEGVVIGAVSSTKPGVLVLESTTQAMVLPHVADPHLNLLSPVAGTMVYDTTSDALAVYDGKEWSYWAASATPAPNNPVGTGSLSGRMCFDVVEQFVSDECGTIVARTPQKANFADPGTNTQTYTFKPTGTVSNVRFMYFNRNGQVIQSITPDADYSGTLTSAQTATATVVYYNNLNTTARGLSREQAFLGDIYVVYNDGTGDKQVMLTARVQDCNCCGAYVTPTLWKEFACHNLGADTSLDPFTPAAGLHGDKYQWGAQKGEAGRYISMADDQTMTYYNNWLLTAKPANSWDGANDPCYKELGAGWRVPTTAEWQGVIANNPRTDATAYPGMSWAGSFTNYSSGIMYGTSLFLPAAGYRVPQTASSVNRGDNGTYREITGGIGFLSFSQTGNGFVTTYPGTNDNATGRSIRCIAQ